MKSDADLILLLGQGDEQAFETIFNRFFDELCRFAKSMVRDKNVAEDIVEDIFMHLWVHCNLNPVTTTIKGYLYRSTYNNSIKYISRKKTFVSLSGASSEEDHNPFVFQADAYSLDSLIAEEMHDKFEQAIDKFPEQCKAIYLMHRDEDLNYRQISDKLHVSESTVKTQMARAYTKLRNCLKAITPVFF